MNLVPSLRQEGANARHARGEAGEVAVEDEQLREDRERPQIEGIAEKLLDRDEFGREIDRAAVESEERRRKEPLGPRHELHELEVVGELEVRTARIGVRNRGDQGREVERLHGFPAPFNNRRTSLVQAPSYHSARSPVSKRLFAALNGSATRPRLAVPFRGKLRRIQAL